MKNAAPQDVESLRSALAEALARADVMTARADAMEAELTRVRAEDSDKEALISHLKLEIAKLRRELYGQRSERKARLLDQLEFQLEDLEATATEDELAAEQTAAKAGTSDTTTVKSFTRRRPGRRPLPEHLPRERVVLPTPTTCPDCGSDDLSKIGEDVTETLEEIPRQLKVVQTVREKVSCRCCAAITQPPAPFHPTPRGWGGPNLLAGILFAKFGEHQPLNRQSRRFADEGVEVSLSTLADQVGACAVALRPLFELVKAHVMAAERLHGDDTTVPVLAKNKTDTGRLWVYTRDDAPFAGAAAPAALFAYSRNRRAEHPLAHLAGYQGILQADAYSGFNPPFDERRPETPLLPAYCWSHGRRNFFKLADLKASARRRKNDQIISPLAFEGVRRIDEIFAVERQINGVPPDRRLAVRHERCRPLVDDLETWMRTERARLSRHNDVAKAMDYMLTRWESFTRFLTDGRVCLSNNAAERSLRGVALGRKAWLFCGSDRGGHRAAMMYTLIVTARMNDVDPRAWLADVLGRIADIPVGRLPELLPWNWRRARETAAA